MKHLPHPSYFALRSLRVSRSLPGAAAWLLGSLLAGCGAFGPEEDDAGYDDYAYAYDDGDFGYRSTTTSTSPSSSGTSSTRTPTSSAATAAPAGTSAQSPSQSSATAASGAGSSSAMNTGAVCGSGCPEELNVRTETRRCAGGPTQGPCYCAAALTYLCFYMNDCYAEAGAPTTLSKTTLDAGFASQLSNAADVDYACKYTADGVTLTLNDVEPTPAQPEPPPSDEPTADPGEKEEPTDLCAGKPGPCAFVAR